MDRIRAIIDEVLGWPEEQKRNDFGQQNRRNNLNHSGQTARTGNKGTYIDDMRITDLKQKPQQNMPANDRSIASAGKNQRFVRIAADNPNLVPANYNPKIAVQDTMIGNTQNVIPVKGTMTSLGRNRPIREDEMPALSSYAPVNPGIKIKQLPETFMSKARMPKDDTKISKPKERIFYLSTDHSKDDFMNAASGAPVKPGMNQATATGAFLRSWGRFADNAVANTFKALQGKEGPAINNKDVQDEYIDWTNEKNRLLEKKYVGTGRAFPRVSKADLSRYGSTTGADMVPAITGEAAGLLGGPYAGLGAGLLTSYRIKEYDTMNEALNKANLKSMKDKHRPLSSKEEENLKKEFKAKAVKSGLWDAGTDVAGKALELGANYLLRRIPGRMKIPDGSAKIFMDQAGKFIVNKTIDYGNKIIKKRGEDKIIGERKDFSDVLRQVREGAIKGGVGNIRNYEKMKTNPVNFKLKNDDSGYRKLIPKPDAADTRKIMEDRGMLHP